MAREQLLWYVEAGGTVRDPHRRTLGVVVESMTAVAQVAEGAAVAAAGTTAVAQATEAGTVTGCAERSAQTYAKRDPVSAA